MDINRLLDTAKEAEKITSDYALAKILEVNNGDVAYWRQNKRHPSVETITRLALIVKLDPMEVIAEIELETAKTAKKRAFWREFLEQHGVAASVIIGLIALLPASQNSEASVLHLKNYTQSSQNLFEKTTVYTLCEVVKITIMRLINALKNSFKVFNGIFDRKENYGLIW